VLVADWSDVGGSDVTPEVTCRVVTANRTQPEQLAARHDDGRRPVCVGRATIGHVDQHTLDEPTL